MKKAKEEGWENITHEELCESFHVDQLTELRNAGLRDQLSPFFIFRQIVSDEFINHIVEATNANYAKQKDKKQGKTMIFSFYDIISLISLIVNACSHQITTFKEYLNDFNRTIGLSTSRYNSVRKYLMFDTKTLHDIFNAGIRSTLNVR